MGEHQRKQKLSHGIDVTIASETHQFDSLSPIDPKQKEAYEKLVLQLARARSLARVFLNSSGGPLALLEEIFVQVKMLRAEMIVQSKLDEEKLGVIPGDFVQATADRLEKIMDMEQIANKLIITPDGVYKD